MIKPIELLPQQPPFLFLDEYLELDEQHCLAKYTFKKDEWFFKGHFPGNPIVPGVILIEAMAQAGVVSIGIMVYASRMKLPMEKIREEWMALFTHVNEAEFLEVVRPGETIFLDCRLTFNRFGKIETGGEIFKLVDGEKKLVCTHKGLTGQGVKIKGGK